jgi:hypothetical protein
MTIQVRKYKPGHRVLFGVGNSQPEFEVVGTIKRKCWFEQIGSLNPMFCTYKGQRTLVHSDAGDLSDPFWREESYLKSLFIRIFWVETPSL